LIDAFRRSHRIGLRYHGHHWLLRPGMAASAGWVGKLVHQQAAGRPQQTAARPQGSRSKR